MSRSLLALRASPRPAGARADQSAAAPASVQLWRRWLSQAWLMVAVTSAASLIAVLAVAATDSPAATRPFPPLDGREAGAAATVEGQATQGGVEESRPSDEAATKEAGVSPAASPGAKAGSAPKDGPAAPVAEDRGGANSTTKPAGPARTTAPPADAERGRTQPGGNGPAPSSTITSAGGGASARCQDPAGDPTTEGQADIDLVEVSLRRDRLGLLVRFELRGSVTARTPTVEGVSATNTWQVLLASGKDVLYAFSVSQLGDDWETNLVDFDSAGGDRFGPLPPPSGKTVEALIPADSLVRLPASFTWWASTSTDRQIPRGIFIGDDCPNGISEGNAELSLPTEASRSTFTG